MSDRDFLIKEIPNIHIEIVPNFIVMPTTTISYLKAMAKPYLTFEVRSDIERKLQLMRNMQDSLNYVVSPTREEVRRFDSCRNHDSLGVMSCFNVTIRAGKKSGIDRAQQITRTIHYRKD